MPLQYDEIEEVIGLIKRELLAAGMVKVQPPQVKIEPVPTPTSTPEPVIESEPIKKHGK